MINVNDTYLGELIYEKKITNRYGHNSSNFPITYNAYFDRYLK
ncbi:hypothetical protein LAA29_120094 [Leuconostoc carnosum]|nr:hypothetical protein LCAC16_150035 [Leuconostoc carnosum]SPO33219.1 hypothetical protein LAA29_120094 [Leuconostoc carnosum]